MSRSEARFSFDYFGLAISIINCGMPHAEANPATNISVVARLRNNADLGIRLLLLRLRVTLEAFVKLFAFRVGLVGQAISSIDDLFWHRRINLHLTRRQHRVTTNMLECRHGYFDSHLANVQ